MAKKMEQLKAERTSVLAEIGRVNQWVTSHMDADPRPSVLMLRKRREVLEERYATCRHIQRQIEVIDSTEIGFKDWLDTEEAYLTSSCVLETQIQSFEDCATPDQSRVQQVQRESTPDQSLLRLPAISLDKFSGADPTQWLSFITKFNGLVHSRPFDRVYKFELLKQSLEGEAARQVVDLELTPSNYETALQLLRNRWGNNTLLTMAHIDKMYSMDPLTKPDPDRLIALVDTYRSNFRALENLNHNATGYEDILVFLVLKKLDRETRSKWDECADDEAFPDLATLFAFIEHRVKALRTSALSSGTKKESSDQETKKSGKSGKSLMSVDGNQQGRQPQKQQANKCTMCTQTGHAIYSCASFLKLPIAERRAKVRSLGICFICLRTNHHAKDCKSGTCRTCNGAHNSLLCLPDVRQNDQPNGSESTGILKGLQQSANHVAAGTSTQHNLLSTAVVLVKDRHGRFIPARALLDSGSQFSFVTEDLRQRLGISKRREVVNVQTLSGNYQGSSTVQLDIRSRINQYQVSLTALVQRRITGQQPNHKLRRELSVPKNLELADPQFNVPGRIDLLLSIEVTAEIQAVGNVRLGHGLPILQNTLLGWVLGGRFDESSTEDGFCALATDDAANEEFDMERFWRLEEIDEVNETQLTAAEQRVEEFYSSTVKKRDDGFYEVRLPFRQGHAALGNSLPIAQSRLKSIERRLERDPNLKEAYQEFMDEYLSLNHMEEVPQSDYSRVRYLIPHHCIVRPESTTTKVRVVFDASASPSDGSSLNDILEKGPQLLQDLYGVLIRFRKWSFTIVADVEKMFRQIRVHDDDTYYQCILWQGKVYRLKTVTYGTRPAPYLAVRTILQCAEDQQLITPRASEVAKRDIFMDDVISGAGSHEEAIDLMQQLNRMCGSCNMRLRKWASNSWSLLSAVAAEDKSEFRIFDDDSYVKTLGLIYHPCDDTFRIRIEIDSQRRVTKRVIQSDIARTFDPLGLVAPIVAAMKIILQRLWCLGLAWDEAPPQDVHTDYEAIRQNLHLLHDHRIPRRIIGSDTPDWFELHGFSDASERAYGACVYLKSVGLVSSVRLISSKSHVAPLKRLTLARLELCAAEMLTTLLSRMMKHLELQFQNVYCWTDSKTVLLWLRKESRHFHTFVANRVSRIQSASFVTGWRHVPTEMNPADFVSRGVSPQRFLEPDVHQLWYSGPNFLQQSIESWPPALPGVESEEETLPEMKKSSSKPTIGVAGTTTDPELDLVEQLDPQLHHSAMRMLRVFAHVHRFIHVKPQQSIPSRPPIESLESMQEALHAIIFIIQSSRFSNERQFLQRNMAIRSGPLRSLNPFLDQSDGLIRVGGRLGKGNYPFSMRHPVVLPPHIFTKALMRFLHYRHQHCGVRALLAIIRQQFWPIHGVRTAQEVVRGCIICFLHRPQIRDYLMGGLPIEALTPGLRPFINVATDFAAGIKIRQQGRGRRPLKAYVCIFICLATHAIHLELVSELTTDAFIGALRRFIGRRGCCRQIFCDNGTNYVGADNELQRLRDEVLANDPQIQSELVTDGIRFRFSPASSPHFNGLAEAAVKSMKHHLRRVLGEADLYYEEMLTLLVQVEATLNSRPLTEMSTDPNDFTALTPAHFIIGEPFSSFLEASGEDYKGNLTQRYRRLGQLHRHFWDRWSKEYLTTRHNRTKWQHPSDALKVGQLVQLVEDQKRPFQWALARIVEIHPGEDGTVRVVSVKTKNGILRRAANRVCVLPCSIKPLEQIIDRKDHTAPATLLL